MFVLRNPDKAEQRLFQFALTAAVLLISLQFADALLTAIGVYRFGIETEGNPLLRELMSHIGPIPALALAKSFAISCILSMLLLVRQVRWVPHALLATSGVYLAFAVLPWGYYLFLFPLL